MRDTSYSNRDGESSNLTGATRHTDKTRDKKHDRMAAAYGIKTDNRSKSKKHLKRASSRSSVRSSHSVKTPMVSRKTRFESLAK